jgi:hypothetical protein
MHAENRTLVVEQAAVILTDRIRRMKNLLLGFVVCFSCWAADDIAPDHVATVPPANARFEVVQSKMTAKGTFKLDRFTGRVWQFLRTDTVEIWSAMDVQGFGTKGIASSAPRFQIFTSGLAFRFTLLLDTQTGSCWQIVSTEKGNDSWQLLLSE